MTGEHDGPTLGELAKANNPKRPTPEEFRKVLEQTTVPEGAFDKEFSEDGRHLLFKVGVNINLRVYDVQGFSARLKDDGGYSAFDKNEIKNYRAMRDAGHWYVAEFDNGEDSVRIGDSSLNTLMVKLGLTIATLYRQPGQGGPETT